MLSVSTTQRSGCHAPSRYMAAFVTVLRPSDVRANVLRKGVAPGLQPASVGAACADCKVFWRANARSFARSAHRPGSCGNRQARRDEKERPSKEGAPQARAAGAEGQEAGGAGGRPKLAAPVWGAEGGRQPARTGCADACELHATVCRGCEAGACSPLQQSGWTCMGRRCTTLFTQEPV